MISSLSGDRKDCLINQLPLQKKDDATKEKPNAMRDYRYREQLEMKIQSKKSNWQVLVIIIMAFALFGLLFYVVNLSNKLQQLTSVLRN